MRTLSWISRAFAAAAALVAVTMIVGGSYFVGFVSEVQRGLSDPASASQQAARQIAAVEQTLGYAGYLKAYRTFRLTGDALSREKMNRHAMDARRLLDILRTFYRETPSAESALSDAASVVDAFATVAQTAPEMGPTALRGTASMDALENLPQAPQLEATYLTLRSALERLRSQTQSHQMGGVAWALSWSQLLIVSSLALLVFGLLCAAGLLQLGITQPLKTLERSLAAIGDGQVAHPVWGTDRADEIGTMARAGEKLRRSLTETTALKALAEKGEVHVRLEGEASVLFEKLASGVTSATEALKAASAGLAGLHDDQRQHFDEALQRFDQVGFKFDDTAHAIREHATQAFADAAGGMRASLARIVDTADERTQRLGQITGQFEQNGKLLSEAVGAIREKTGAAIDGITTSITAFKRASDGAQSIQGAFFSACDRISSDASSTAENIKNLATQLYGVVDHVDGRLNHKLDTLDRLETGIETTLGAIQAKAAETNDAIASAAAALEQRSRLAEARVEQSVDSFEDVVALFRDQNVSAPQPADQPGLNSIVEQLADIAARLSAAPQVPASPSGQPFDVFASNVAQQLAVLRAEIRELAMRITEERIMMTADFPAPSIPHAAELVGARNGRSLADVPINEIMLRLKDLEQEMNAGSAAADPAFALRAALGSFAGTVRALPPDASLQELAPQLARHADEIETGTASIEPSATALRTELEAITDELRRMAESADATFLQETALHLGARAESLFSYLGQTHQPGSDQSETDETIEQTASDLATLAKIIGKLEERASHLSDTAVASNLARQIDAASPSERPQANGLTSPDNEDAIAAVFESIERLNNIAAALARASDASLVRKFAG